MKKSILILANVYLLLVSSSIFAQADPGDDPDVPAPIDDYVWMLALVAITVAIFKFKAIYKQNLRTKE